MTEPANPIRVYLGQAFYDSHGRLIDEVGNSSPAIAKQHIDKAMRALDGKWAYCLIKAMKQMSPGSKEQWSNKLLFPDGKSREIREQPYEQFRRDGNGAWLSPEAAARVSKLVKEAPSIRFVYGQQTVELKRTVFSDMLEFERFAKDQTTTIFVGRMDDQAPEEGLVAYLAVAPY